MKSLHLPVQSGSNEILKKMNRGYTVESYKALFDDMKNRIPEITFTTDLIVGFPGETEQDFDELSEFIQEAQFDKLGVFTYSREEDTPADKLPTHHDEETKVERQERLMMIQQGISEEKNNNVITLIK